MTPKFLKAVAWTIGDHEGGDADVAGDRGGRTRYGISHAAYPNEDIENLTLERALFLYYRDYWKVNDLDQLPTQLAGEVFDFGVVAGPGRAARVLQMALRELGQDVAVDGQLGPATRDAVKKATLRYSAKHLIAMQFGLQWEHYRAIVRNNASQQKFWAGWVARAYDAAPE